MKIAILLPDLRFGGAERISLDLAYELARMGHEVEFIPMQAHGELLEEAQSAFPVLSLACTRARQMPLPLAHYLRSRRPEGLIAAMWPLTVVAPLARLLSGVRIPCVIAEHGMLSAQYRSRGQAHRLLLRGSMAAGYRMADARVGVSAGMIGDMAELSCLGRQRFAVIHNPVPSRPAPSAEALGEADRLWGVPAGGRLLAVGRFKPVKNYPLLLQAFARLERRDARLVLVGSGDSEGDLRSLCGKLGLADRVVFAGFRDPTPFYHTADLLALSSDHEGLPTVLIEALACGLPVVSTDCPSGPAEILVDGKYGTLVPVGDAEALARAIEQALDRPHDRERLRARARDFAPEKAAKAYLKLMFPSA